MAEVYFPNTFGILLAASCSGGFWRLPSGPAEALEPVDPQTHPGTITYRELRELRRPTGEKSTGELSADPRGRPFLPVARGVEPGPTPPSGPLRAPGPGVRGEETAGNMTEGRGDEDRACSDREDAAPPARSLNTQEAGGAR